MGALVDVTRRTTVSQRRSVARWIGATFLSTTATAFLLPTSSWAVPGVLAALLALITGAQTLRIALRPPSALQLSERLLFAFITWTGLLRLTASGFTLFGSAGASSTAFLLTLLLGGPLGVALVGTWAFGMRRLAELEHAHRRLARHPRANKVLALWRPAPPAAMAAALTVVMASFGVACRAKGLGTLASAVVLLAAGLGALAFAAAFRTGGRSSVSLLVMLSGHVAASVLSAPFFFAVRWLIPFFDPNLDIENNHVSFLVEVSVGFCLWGLRFWLVQRRRGQLDDEQHLRPLSRP